MRKVLAAGVAGMFVLALPIVALANPTWTTGYPKPGANNGEIAVKGTFDIPAGYSTSGSMQIVVVPVGGGEQKYTTINIGSGSTGTITWGESVITGLTSDQEYWVITAIPITNGTVTKTYCPDGAKSKAK